MYQFNSDSEAPFCLPEGETSICITGEISFAAASEINRKLSGFLIDTLDASQASYDYNESPRFLGYSHSGPVYGYGTTITYSSSDLFDGLSIRKLILPSGVTLKELRRLLDVCHIYSVEIPNSKNFLFDEEGNAINKRTQKIIVRKTEPKIFSCENCGSKHYAAEMYFDTRDENGNLLYVCKDCVKKYDYCRCSFCGRLKKAVDMCGDLPYCKECYQ